MTEASLIVVEGSTADVHRAMRGEKADLTEVIEAARLVARHPDVRLKLATVVSAVNRDDLPALAATVRGLAPDVWRLYQYSSRGDQNFGRQRHWLPDDEFGRLASQAAALAAPVPTAPSTEAETEGCLIVDPSGNVLEPAGASYVRRSCLRNRLTASGRKARHGPRLSTSAASVLSQPTAHGYMWHRKQRPADLVLIGRVGFATDRTAMAASVTSADPGSRGVRRLAPADGVGLVAQVGEDSIRCPPAAPY
jgi:hypothetical protein